MGKRTDLPVEFQFISVDICAYCLNTVWFILNLFSFWESGNLVHTRQRVPAWPAPNKNCGCWLLKGSLGRKMVHLLHFHGPGQVCLVCSLMRVREHKEACTWTSPLLHLCLFLLWSDVCLHYIAVITLRSEYGYMLSPLAPSRASLSPGVVLGTLNQLPYRKS